MEKPTLITMCKSRSGRDLKLGSDSEWDRIRAEFADRDYIDLQCVMEFLEARLFSGEYVPPIWMSDLEPILKAVTHYVSSHPNLLQILPPSLDCARIARELLKEVLDL